MTAKKNILCDYVFLSAEDNLVFTYLHNTNTFRVSDSIVSHSGGVLCTYKVSVELCN
jgi:hypothetical protein